MSDLSHFKTYKIGHAAKVLDVNTSVLRFWESEFDQLDPVRTASGQRLYTEEHLALLRRIRSLLYDEGLTIEGARKRLLDGDAPAGDSSAATLPDTRAPAQAADKTVLREIRDELQDILALIDRS